MPREDEVPGPHLVLFETNQREKREPHERQIGNLVFSTNSCESGAWFHSWYLSERFSFVRVLFSWPFA